MDTLDNWDSLMNFRVHLIACGGTALTLLKIKDSTKDIDFIVPEENEYQRLMKFLKHLNYGDKGGGLAHEDDPNFIYQFWCGSRVFTTDLLDSPLEKGKHILIKKWTHIYLGALNLIDLIITKMFRGDQVDRDDCIAAIDLIITKMFRGDQVDRDDCIAAFATGQVNPEELLDRYSETAGYDLNPEKVMQNIVSLAEDLSEKQLISNEFYKKVRSKL
jgi:hypothetical protein